MNTTSNNLGESWLPLPTRPAKALRTFVAVHEAGHACAGVLLGATEGYVTIVPLLDSHGHCCMTIPASASTAVYHAAGDAAVEIFRDGGAVMLDRLSGSSSEPTGENDAAKIFLSYAVDAIRDHDMQISRGAFRKYSHAALIIAGAMLLPHWFGVQQVAAELLARRRLTANRVRELIQKPEICRGGASYSPSHTASDSPRQCFELRNNRQR
jgi:hypothetical protein